MVVKLKPEVKELWIKGLESGEFNQAQNQLRESESGAMCCLGVLCELYRRETGGGEWKYNGESWVEKDFGFFDHVGNFSSQALPLDVVRWAIDETSLSSEDINDSTRTNEILVDFDLAYDDEEDDPDIDRGVYCTTLNDQKGYTFPEIARVIREKL